MSGTDELAVMRDDVTASLEEDVLGSAIILGGQDRWICKSGYNLYSINVINTEKMLTALSKFYIYDTNNKAYLECDFSQDTFEKYFAGECSYIEGDNYYPNRDLIDYWVYDIEETPINDHYCPSISEEAYNNISHDSWISVEDFPFCKDSEGKYAYLTATYIMYLSEEYMSEQYNAEYEEYNKEHSKSLSSSSNKDSSSSSNCEDEKSGSSSSLAASNGEEEKDCSSSSTAGSSGEDEKPGTSSSDAVSGDGEKSGTSSSSAESGGEEGKPGTSSSAVGGSSEPSGEKKEDSGSSTVVSETVKKVPLTSDTDSYAAAEDNIAPIMAEGAINRLKLDFSKVSGSTVASDSLRMTVIKGSKLTVTDVKTVEGNGVKVKVKNGIATITAKMNGQASFEMNDGNRYSVYFAVETPKASTNLKTISVDPANKKILTIRDMFGTTIDSGTLTVVKDKVAGQAVVDSSNNTLVLTPKEKDKIQIQYKYLNKKYKLTIKIK